MSTAKIVGLPRPRPKQAPELQPVSAPVRHPAAPIPAPAPAPLVISAAPSPSPVVITQQSPTRSGLPGTPPLPSPASNIHTGRIADMVKKGLSNHESEQLDSVNVDGQLFRMDYTPFAREEVLATVLRPINVVQPLFMQMNPIQLENARNVEIESVKRQFTEIANKQHVSFIPYIQNCKNGVVLLLRTTYELVKLLHESIFVQDDDQEQANLSLEEASRINDKAVKDLIDKVKELFAFAAVLEQDFFMAEEARLRLLFLQAPTEEQGRSVFRAVFKHIQTEAITITSELQSYISNSLVTNDIKDNNYRRKQTNAHDIVKYK